MRSIFFSHRLIFYEDIFSFDGSWYGLGDVIVELAHKITAGKADQGCSTEQTKRKRRQKEFLSFLLRRFFSVRNHIRRNTIKAVVIVVFNGFV